MSIQLRRRKLRPLLVLRLVNNRRHATLTPVCVLVLFPITRPAQPPVDDSWFLHGSCTHLQFPDLILSASSGHLPAYASHAHTIPHPKHFVARLPPQATVTAVGCLDTSPLRLHLAVPTSSIDGHRRFAAAPFMSIPRPSINPAPPGLSELHIPCFQPCSHPLPKRFLK